MEDTEKLIGIPVGQPVSQLRAVACSALIGVTMLLGFLGCVATFSSSPKDQEAGYRLIRVAKVSGDITKTVCNC